MQRPWVYKEGENKTTVESDDVKFLTGSANQMERIWNWSAGISEYYPVRGNTNFAIRVYMTDRIIFMMAVEGFTLTYYDYKVFKEVLERLKKDPESSVDPSKVKAELEAPKKSFWSFARDISEIIAPIAEVLL